MVAITDEVVVVSAPFIEGRVIFLIPTKARWADVRAFRPEHYGDSPQIVLSQCLRLSSTKLGNVVVESLKALLSRTFWP